MKRLFLLYILALLGVAGFAQPRPDYYSASLLDGKRGLSLELALADIVYGHTKLKYDELWKCYETTDLAPADSIPSWYTGGKTDLVYDMYAWMGQIPKFYSDNNHSQTGGINREHCVPNSWWGAEVGNPIAYTDLHHLVPSDGAANNAKQNHPLGEWTEDMQLQWPTADKKNSQGLYYVKETGSASHVWKIVTNADRYGNAACVFEPADEYKGDFARMYLYVVCAYERNITWMDDCTYMFSSNAENITTISPWAIDLLLRWHRQDPVSPKELDRNNAVEELQGNRNPFIDYPELVEYIWGDKQNDSFSLANATCSYDNENMFIFYESFNKNQSTGGNDDIWSGTSTATGTIVYDNSGWDAKNARGAYKCGKFGTASTDSWALTPQLRYAGNAILTFRAAAWNVATESTDFAVEIIDDDNDTATTIAEINLEKGKWTDYAIALDNLTWSKRIRFAGRNEKNNRFFLDEVKVKAAEINYEREEMNGTLGTICLPYGVEPKYYWGADFYELAFYSSAKEKMYFSQVETLEAGMPYIFIMNDDRLQMVYNKQRVDAPKNHNGLYGTFTDHAFSSDKQFAEGNYYVVVDNKIQQATASSGVKAHRAYIKLSEVPDAPTTQKGSHMLVVDGDGFGYDDEEDGIVVPSLRDSDDVYDLQGRKMPSGNLPKGIYIKRGKVISLR